MQAMSHPTLYHPNLIFPIDHLNNALYKESTEKPSYELCVLRLLTIICLFVVFKMPAR